MLVLIDSLTAGGAELLLGEFVAATSRDDLRVSVAHLSETTESAAAERLRAAGVEPVALGMRGLLHPATLKAVRRHVAAVNPDLVHTQLDYADTIGGLAARSLGIPSVATIHVMEWPTSELRDRVRGWVTSTIRRQTAAAMITVSEAAKHALIDSGRARPERAVKIHNGVAARLEAGAGARVREELGIRPDDYVVSQVAVLRAGKGHSVACKAFGKFKDRCRRARFLIIGDGPCRADVERLAQPLGEDALMLGHRDDVMTLLDASDVIISPSTADAFPTVLLEAMAAGVPVVATSVGGIPEIVNAGETGFLVSDPADVNAFVHALWQLASDEPLRMRMSAASRARYEEEFTASRWAEQVLQLYRRVIAEARSSGRVR